MRAVVLTAALVAAFLLIPVAPTALLASWPFMLGAAHASPLAGDPSLPSVIGAAKAEWPPTGRADTLSIARRHLGTNPTGKRSLWCADFANLVERKAGRAGTGSRLARSFLGYGKPVTSPRPGDIVVLWRGSPRARSGHVGYVLADEGSRIRIISGNHGRKVGIGTYPKSRVLGYRRP